MSSTRSTTDSIEGGFSLRVLTGIRDDALCDWLDLYQTSFPLNEQFLVSTFLRALRRQEMGADPDCILLALERTEDSAFHGLACCRPVPEAEAVWLWYLAVTQQERGQGLGGRLYRGFRQWAEQQFPGTRAVVFEVERPDRAADESQRSVAERRIRFYRRHGALLMPNLAYHQSVGWQPCDLMYLMLHPLQPVTPAEAGRMVRIVFGDAVEPFDLPVLE